MNAQEGTILHHKNPVIQNHKNPVIQSNREGRKDNFSYATYLLNLKWAKPENLKRYSGKKKSINLAQKQSDKSCVEMWQFP